MDHSLCATRVNASNLGSHRGGTVLFVGAITDATSSPATLTSTDDKPIFVHLNPTLPLERFQSHYVEVLGRVQDDLSILEEKTVPFKGEINKDAWNVMIDLMHKHREIYFEIAQ